MSSEKPVRLKQRRKTKLVTKSERRCVIHNNNLKRLKEILAFSEITWKNVKDCKDFYLKNESTKENIVEICEQMPDIFYETCHGYHLSCYTTFIRSSSNLTKTPQKRKVKVDYHQAGCSRAKRAFHGNSVLFDKDTCIFCKRKWKWSKKKQECLSKCVTETAQISILEAAKLKDDTKMISLIENYCLIAHEAHYHHTCRKDYTRSDARHLKSETNSDRNELLEAHNYAFEYICDYVKTEVIENCNVERMTMLKEKYQTFMQSKYYSQYNPDYKTQNLKVKLKKRFGDKLSFWQPNYRSDLVYSSGIETGIAVEAAFQEAASDKRRLKEAAILLRRLIIDSFKQAPEMPWPPSSNFLLSSTKNIPEMLTFFMTQLLSAKPNQSNRLERIVSSLSQDICYKVTRGQWKLPKHLLLGMTVRHISGSSQLIKLLNSFGHCSSHSTLLELETAMCDSVTESASSLPAAALTNPKMTQFCWDNFDLFEETPNGSGTTHSTHGIIIQESPDEIEGRINAEKVIEKTKRRSAIYTPTVLDPCFMTINTETTLSGLKSTIDSTTYEREVAKNNFLWIFNRLEFNENENVIPSWKGWVSETSMAKKETKKSVIDYMPTIQASINKPSTIQKVIEISEATTREVGQEYTFVTFYFPVARKAYHLTWQYPERYKKVVIHFGVFHIQLSYLGAIGKLVKSSGFEEIVYEAELCATGSMEKVINGKHYNRRMRVHIIMTEALERLLFNDFVQCSGQ